MATKRDPYALDYAEDTTGTFSSDRGGYGSATRSVAAPTALNNPRGQSALQMKNQDDFDKAQGFTPVLRSAADRTAISGLQAPAPSPVSPTAPVSPPIVPTAPVPATPFIKTGNPLDILSGLGPKPDFDAAASTRPPQYDTSLASSDPVFPVEQSGATVAGARVRASIGRGVTWLGRKAAAAGRGILTSFADYKDPEQVQAEAVAATLGPPLAAGVKAAGDFTGGLLTGGKPGRSVASGVSNSSAAQFTQPTKSKPVITPTSPAANIDRSENAIGKFGLTDAEFNRKKLAFAGF
jgi:hypothetical protein